MRYLNIVAFATAALTAFMVITNYAANLPQPTVEFIACVFLAAIGVALAAAMVDQLSGVSPRRRAFAYRAPVYHRPSIGRDNSFPEIWYGAVDRDTADAMYLASL